MAKRSRPSRSARRRNRRYIGMLVLLVALIGGWSWFWHYAAGRAETAIAGWRAREAKAGRVYTCGSQTIGGYPFRIEVTCGKAAALFRSNQPPVEVKTGEMLIAAQIYDPTLLITEFHGPLSVADTGKAAVPRGELDARPVERARHAGGAAARLAGVRRSEGRSPRQRQSNQCAACQAHRGARAHRRRNGDQPPGDRDRDAAAAGRGADPASRRRASARCRHYRGAARSERFLAQALAGAFPRNPGGGRAHRHRGCARAAGRHHRGRQRQSRAQRQRTARRPAARHRRRA